MNQQFIDLLSTVNLSQSHWEVGASDAIELLRALAASWGVRTPLTDALKDARTLEELSDRLQRLGVSFAPDPGECSRSNNTSVEQVARAILRYAAAHALRYAEAMTSGPSDDLEPYLQAAASKLTRECMRLILNEIACTLWRGWWDYLATMVHTIRHRQITP